MSDLLDQARNGGKAGVARLLTAIEAQPTAPDTLAALDAAFMAQSGVCLALTGPPGVGKSTLIDAWLREERSQGRRVAVAAVDPSSRRTGGAVLGDRARLSFDPMDQGVFVRSIAARDRLGGLAAVAYPITVALRALYDTVILETVGVGQSETEAAETADAVIFCAQPSSGDALQYMKSGVMEIPNLLLVTKADLGAPARRAAADAKSALSLGAAQAPEVLLVSATSSPAESGVADAVSAGRAVGASRATNDARRAQLSAWGERRILEQFGTVGASITLRNSELADENRAPFTRLAATEVALLARFQRL